MFAYGYTADLADLLEALLMHWKLREDERLQQVLLAGLAPEGVILSCTAKECSLWGWNLAGQGLGTNHQPNFQP